MYTIIAICILLRKSVGPAHSDWHGWFAMSLVCNKRWQMSCRCAALRAEVQGNYTWNIVKKQSVSIDAVYGKLEGNRWRSERHLTHPLVFTNYYRHNQLCLHRQIFKMSTGHMKKDRVVFVIEERPSTDNNLLYSTSLNHVPNHETVPTCKYKTRPNEQLMV